MITVCYQIHQDLLVVFPSHCFNLTLTFVYAYTHFVFLCMHAGSLRWVFCDYGFMFVVTYPPALTLYFVLLHNEWCCSHAFSHDVFCFSNNFVYLIFFTEF